MTMRGSLFVVSAPSGTGKSTLCQRLYERVPGIRHSVSYTTRLPRPGEIADVHYTFVDEEEFRGMIGQGEFAEWAQVHGNFYGTATKRLEATLSSGSDIMLDIDVQGAQQIREHFPDSVHIFILPPTFQELTKRLKGRKSESKESVRERLLQARNEIREYENYDYVIVNDDFETALQVLIAVVMAERARTAKVDHAWIRERFLKEE